MSQILIIEDEPRIAAFVAKGLKAAGYSGHIQSSGAVGAQLAVTDDFDLVLLDVGLPDIDGFEALNRLRGQGVTTPVIMLTARSSVTDTVAGLECGAETTWRNRSASRSCWPGFGCGCAATRMRARRPAR